jgi:Ca2+-transporting ATPase
VTTSRAAGSEEAADGLTSAEARARLAEHGPNVAVPTRRHPRVWEWLVRGFADPMTMLLLVAGVTYLLLGDTTSAIVAFGAIVPLAATGFVLETRAEHALDELARLTAPTALAQRDGDWTVIPADAVVPGDLLLVQEGDVVVADGHLEADTQLSVDEAALTGESQPVEKSLDENPAVYAGTTVLSGRARMRVDATGAATQYGRVGSLVAQTRPPRTPLERAVRGAAARLAAVATGFVLAVAGVELLHGSGWGAALLAGVSLAIAIAPEELPIVYTLYLALGARRLAREHALVRRLAGVETLGSTTVICTDKTGTLTLGHIALGALVPADGNRRDPGDAPVGAALELLEAAVLASEPTPFDPLDQAIAGAARDQGIDVDALHALTLVRDYAFDPGGKYMSHVWRDGGPLRIAAKGSVEGILDRSAVDDETRARAEAANVRLADEGMRVIAVATGSIDASIDRAHDESALRFVGLVGFHDPLRPGVADAIRECGEAGIRVVMITGDHPVTAHAVAEGLGLQHEDEAIATGLELDAADDAEVRQLVSERTIFARIRPEQKHRLVEALRHAGEVVAMTGDGINDAPALREADIGVAMGGRGSQVARQSATMVLLDDNFATIVTAVREGRRIVDNLRVAFEYLAAFHVPVVAAALLVPLTGQPLFLLPVHLILLQIVVHPTVALAFEGDEPAADVMRRPPRGAGAMLGDRARLLRSLLVGSTLALAVLAVFFLGIDAGESGREARTWAFAVLLVGDVLLVLVVRAGSNPFWRVPTRSNRMVIPIMSATLAVVGVAMFVPTFRDRLGLATPRLVPVLVAVLAAMLATTWPSIIAEARLRFSHSRG